MHQRVHTVDTQGKNHDQTPTPRRFVGIVTQEASSDTDLARELSEVVEGEVRFDPGSRATYSTDASNYRQVPVGVVLPETIEDVIATVRVCRSRGVPITSRGGGTSLAGQACNAAVIIDFSKYLNRVIYIDPDHRTAVVEPGCVLDTLRERAAQHGLTFGPDPATHDRNTLGGMLGNNSCGVHSVMSSIYGPGPLTVHQVRELDVLTYDGQRMTVGPTDPETLETIASGVDRRAQIYRDLRDLRDLHMSEIRSRYPDIPRRVSGYNLDWLLPEKGFDVAKALVGSEGTCVIILSAALELIEAKPKRTLVVLGYPDAATAADHVPDVIDHGPVGLEGLDSKLVGYMKKKGLHPQDVEMLPSGEGWLLAEFGADTKAEADSQAKELMSDLGSRDDSPDMKLFEDEWEEEKIWQVRESGLGATAHVPGMPRTHPGWEDAAVPPERVGDYLRDFRALLDEFGYDAALYGHFGQGCVHCRIDFDFSTKEGVDLFTRFLDRAADLVVGYGGSFSGEHGDGQARAALLPKMYGDELVGAFGVFKGIWDPDGKMNPGKVVDPYRPDENLREGPERQPLQLETHFAFDSDGGSFAAAAARCVGVGKCRDVRSGTMCPSYMATREEEDSTRGRARLLFEMLQGDPLGDGWRDKSVKEALDLCLACKGCKNECPVNVDMATYKAEFLSHYYKGRVRPRVAYSMGLIYWWARIASHMPRLVNFLARRPPFARALKKVGGVSGEREIPRFAKPTFRAWFAEAVPTSAGRAEPGAPTGGAHGHVPRFAAETYSADESAEGARLKPLEDMDPIDTDRVILWPDTFNNYLDTRAARSAVRVLGEAGYRVEIPERPLCCGRPLYDWGMLERAKLLWRQTLGALGPALHDGVPVVGLEPSCLASFKDELVGLFPDDEAARLLADNTYLLSDFLVRQRYEIPRLERSAIVQGHCHHKAVMHMDSEVSVLEKMGLDHEVLDSGCCGMAGAFGFDDRHYEVSMRVGERVLLPRVRSASATTLIMANGFSCREQIAQSTDRRALHLAEVIDMAHQCGRDGPAGDYPENWADGRTNYFHTKGN